MKIPKFMNEDEEAKWWAGAEGREFLKRQSATGTAKKRKGSPLVSGLSRSSSGMSAEILAAHLNDFALRCFRDIADGDYIAARMAYRADLIPQALWASQQAIEKYIKCVLLLRRIEWNESSHALVKPLEKLEKQFALRLTVDARDFIKYLDTYGTDRYFALPYYAEGQEIVKLDKTIWQMRRYCIPYSPGKTPKGTPIIELDLKRIEDAERRHPRLYRPLVPGPLDDVIQNDKHPARAALIWNNLYFSKSRRQCVRMAPCSQWANSPLALYPHILDEVSRYVFVPKSVRQWVNNGGQPLFFTTTPPPSTTKAPLPAR